MVGTGLPAPMAYAAHGATAFGFSGSWMCYLGNLGLIGMRDCIQLTRSPVFGSSVKEASLSAWGLLFLFVQVFWVVTVPSVLAQDNWQRTVQIARINRWSHVIYPAALLLVLALSFDF